MGRLTPPAASGSAAVSLVVMQKRSQFLAAARAARVPAGSFMLQARKRGPDKPPDVIQVGFTCSKKVGNAVARNRAKRRLREAARLVLPEHGHPGWDYVLIGRREQTAARDFQDLLDDLRRALAKVHDRAPA